MYLLISHSQTVFSPFKNNLRKVVVFIYLNININEFSKFFVKVEFRERELRVSERGLAATRQPKQPLLH